VALPLLRQRLLARDFAVVCSAADALGALGDSASIPALTTLLRRTGGPEAADIRSAAKAALAALGRPADSTATEPVVPLRVEPIPSRPATAAVVRTQRGVIRIALDAASAPRTVENFARLARERFFDGLVYHRVVPNFVVQDGCPRGDGWGSPGYSIPCEYNDKPYAAGTVGMALSGKDTGGSQWFITLSPQPRLEGRYTVFGEVVSGMDVVERIQPGDRILSIEIK
jgi:cyclophilin family peptidyl-prolyl cis-trans isomerase